jgi:hypothetical protein
MIGCFFSIAGIAGAIGPAGLAGIAGAKLVQPDTQAFRFRFTDFA